MKVDVVLPERSHELPVACDPRTVDLEAPEAVRSLRLFPKADGGAIDLTASKTPSPLFSPESFP